MQGLRVEVWGDDQLPSGVSFPGGVSWFFRFFWVGHSQPHHISGHLNF